MNPPSTSLHTARPPLSFSVVAAAHARCLFLAPCTQQQLYAALPLPADDQAVLVYPSGRTVLTDWQSAADAPSSVELVHLPAAQDADLSALPVPLQLDLEQALLPGSRAAVSALDGAHALLISDDDALLRAGLRAALAQLGPLPPIPDATLDVLLRADDWAHHHDVSLQAGRRYWTLQIDRRGPSGVQTTRLVCEGPGGHWRVGWTW